MSMRITRKEAYDAGRDAALNGGNDSNSSFVFFTSEKLKNWWQEGYDSVKKGGS